MQKSFVYERKINYYETDKMGIVHHSVYPIWYELARTNFIKEIGIYDFCLSKIKEE